MKGCEITMFTNISFSTYGRCVKGSEWTIMNSLGTNRLYYIHSGNIAARVGGRDLMLEERNLYIFPQNLEFKLFPNDSVSVDHTFYDFWTIPVIKSDDIIQISSLSDYPLISSALAPLFSINEKYPMYPIIKRNKYYNLVKSYLDNLLYLINEDFRINTIDDDVINKSINHIHQKYYDNISIKELADEFNLDVSFFIKKFKIFTNQTPAQYIKAHRMSIAYNYLKSKKYSLSEIAEMVGYQDAASLSHTFKKTYGVSPKYIDKI